MRITHRRTSNPLLSWAAPLLFGGSLLLIWWLATSLGDVEPWVFPSPREFWVAAKGLLAEPWFWQRAGTTTLEALLGSAIGICVAVPLAWGIYRSNFIRAALEPFLGATQAIPAVALAPLLVLWIGHGMAAIVALCALIVFFPVLVSTVVGLRGMDPDVLDAAALDGASGFRLIFSVEMPLAAPVMLAGIRNGFTLSITGAIVGEMVMGGTGLGQVLSQQKYNLDTAGMFVTVAMLALLAMTLYSLVYTLERRLKTAADSSGKKSTRKSR